MKTNNTLKNSVIKTDQLEIGENVFKYNRTVIQLSNISYFNIAPMTKMEYPMRAFVGAFIGLLLLFMNQEILILAGLIVIVASVYEIYRINKNNNNLGEYLILRLNSGDVLHFSCYSKEFLYAIEGVIAQCFKDSEMKCKIDLKDCVITYQEDNMNIHNNSGNIVKGDGNTVTATNTGNISEQVQISDDEWIQVEKAFGEIASGLDVNSKEHMLAVSAQYQAGRKNKVGLREIIMENINDFRNSIFSQMAVAGGIEIVKKITGLSL